MLTQSTYRQRTSATYPEEQVAETIRRRLQNCQHGFIFRKVSATFEDGRLVLRGCVPSFYLKQNLQELLRGIPHVEQIVNNVDVICSNGLSSIRPH